VYACTVMSAV